VSLDSDEISCEEIEEEECMHTGIDDSDSDDDDVPLSLIFTMTHFYIFTYFLHSLTLTYCSTCPINPLFFTLRLLNCYNSLYLNNNLSRIITPSADPLI
jgi:hypothetical protein